MMLSEEDIHTKSTDSYEFSDNGVKKLPSSILFLPQKPYNVIGTLRQQISYPSIVDDSDDWSIQEDSYLLDILEKVKLGDLALRVGNGNERKGLNANKDWSKVLSLGEQQRLAFARILYNKPSVVALDEATSALDKDAEESVYNLLIETNTTYISVGHNPSLLRFHQKKLVLYGPTHNLKIENIPHISTTNTSKLF
jgi:putative ATP-binding cassette transporter